MGINRSKKSWSVGVEYFLVPIITDLYLAPSHLLQFVRCKCKTKNRRSSTSLCSFRKHGLKCVSSCGTCRGVSCEHSDIRDLILISHYYMGSKRPERTISLYDFGTIAPSTLILSINLVGNFLWDNCLDTVCINNLMWIVYFASTIYYTVCIVLLYCIIAYFFHHLNRADYLLNSSF